jgi:hypothetical protein
MPLDLNKLTHLSAERDECKVMLSRVEEEHERVTKKLVAYRERISSIEALITAEVGSPVTFDTSVDPIDVLIMSAADVTATPKLETV